MNALYEEMSEFLETLKSVEPVSLENALYTLKTVQGVVSKPVEGCIPEEGEFPTKDAIRTYALAMMVETAEFVQTLNWKPWKDKQVIDRYKVVDEFADILAFMGILVYYMELLGISQKQLADGYTKKSIENIERFLGKHNPEYKQKSLFDMEEI